MTTTVCDARFSREEYSSSTGHAELAARKEHIA
jgi:hypothetical protein